MGAQSSISSSGQDSLISVADDVVHEVTQSIFWSDPLAGKDENEATEPLVRWKREVGRGQCSIKC